MAENNKQKDSEVASPNQDAAAEESAAAEGQADQVNQVEELEAADELGDGAAQDDDLFDSDPELDDKMDKQVEEGSAKADIVRCDNDVDIASRADPDAHADDQVYDLYAVSVGQGAVEVLMLHAESRGNPRWGPLCFVCLQP